MWTREPEVVQILRHFDQPERNGQWSRLTSKELGVIQRELQKCRQDFSYAARNYFMIVTKDGEDIPFRLWESQELLLEKWYWLREKHPQSAQRIMIIKARQLGLSTLIEGLIAWATIFFSNRNAMVVSHSDLHSSYLFQIMLDIYDRLPWWLKPMLSSRKQDEGLVFDNPDYDDRRDHPGNQSKVIVQSANQVSGVGQGMRLNAVHLSEFSDWQWDKFRDIIQGDMIHALADNINSFAFLESTGKGSGSPSEEMWIGQVKLAEKGLNKWYPLFLPWFFEKRRVLAPPSGWNPAQPEADMRRKVSQDWTRCSNPKCSLYFESSFEMASRVGTVCKECGAGTLQPMILTDGQLRFMQVERMNAEEEGLEAVKNLRQELCSTSVEAFQLSGIQVFPPPCHEFVAMCIDNNPIIWGDIDDKGQVHYMETDEVGCWYCALPHCQADHRWDTEHPLKIWELPIVGCQYSIGVDVAEGLGGKADWSIIWINKVSPNGQWPDEQVGVWASNTVDPIALASPINFLGRMYNDALVSVEVNKFDSCFNTVRLQYLYPNLFIWKHYDSKNVMSQKMGWVTNLRSKPMLWQTAVRWLKARMWIVRSQDFAEEMKRFQKEDYDDQRASAERNFHDDYVIAGLIALFCAHDMDYSEGASFIPVPVSQRGPRTADWTNTCQNHSCGKTFNTEEYPARKCPNCGCMLVQSHRNSDASAQAPLDWAELSKLSEEEGEGAVA